MVVLTSTCGADDRTTLLSRISQFIIAFSATPLVRAARRRPILSEE